jgi:hypothetical protein
MREVVIMTPLRTRTAVGIDGNVVIPIGKEQAGKEVLVTIAPAPRTMSQDEWKEVIDRTAGSIDDPTFVRHGQGDWENREPLE